MKKINKFYFIIAIVVTVATMMVIYVFRSIFSSIGVAYDVSISVPDSELKIDKDRLNHAYDIIINKEAVSLEVK